MVCKLQALCDSLVSVPNYDAPAFTACRISRATAMLGAHDDCLVAPDLPMRLPPLPELQALERIIELGAGQLASRVVCEVNMPLGGTCPIHVVTLGNPSLDVPAVG